MPTAGTVLQWQCGVARQRVISVGTAVVNARPQ